jgi:hypothetical protein
MLEETIHGRRKAQQEMKGMDNFQQRSRLIQLLEYCFNESELRDLCLELGVDYDVLPGVGKAHKARELVFWSERRKSGIEKVVQVCSALRPKAPWNTPSTTRYEPYTFKTLAELSRTLSEHFDGDQVRDFCVSLRVDHKRLLGVDPAGVARELVLYLARRERIPELIAACARLRPDLSW